MTARLPAIGGVAFAFAALVAVTFSVTETLDYAYQVAPAMNALLDGQIGEFFRVQPVYGGFSVLVRLPFAALAQVFGGDQLLVYQLGAIPCVAALAVAALAVTRGMAARGRTAGAQLLVGALIVVNPATVAALQRGHPEELLTCALLIGAVLMAIRGRPLAATALLGLAIGTKQWALLAAAPVLLLCARSWRFRGALVAAAIVAALTVPMAVADPGRFATNNRQAQGGWYHASRLSVWWPLASTREVEPASGGSRALTVYELPPKLTTLARPAVLALAVLLAVAFWHRRRGLGPEDTLALLALLLLLRCILDPTNNDYYHLPFLAFLGAWEGLRTRRLPVFSLCAAAGLWATLHSHWLSPQALGDQFQLVNNVFYLAWTVPLVAWLAWATLRRPLGGLSAGGAGGRRLIRAAAPWREPQSAR